MRFKVSDAWLEIRSGVSMRIQSGVVVVEPVGDVVAQPEQPPMAVPAPEEDTPTALDGDVGGAG
jgi:hypothetical protein